jgi:hypothetical protein
VLFRFVKRPAEHNDGQREKARADGRRTARWDVTKDRAGDSPADAAWLSDYPDEASEPAKTSVAGDRVTPADRRRMVGFVDLGRPVARGSGGGRDAEVVPLGPVPEEDPDRAPAGRAVRLGAVADAAEGRGPVAGQKCECHRHLFDIEQSQPIKPGSPLNVCLRPELINGQRAFHT